MTTDAVGGVWRYSVDLAREFSAGGDHVILAGLGPPPSAEQAREAQPYATLLWLSTPPEWLARDESDLKQLPGELTELASAYRVDLVHLNAPAQAAGLCLPCPIVAVSHSCVATWMYAVGSEMAGCWAWQHQRNRRGFDNANAAVAPSRSHADMLETCYGPIGRLGVVHNGARPGPIPRAREPFVFAAARWWDPGKNAAVLDAAAPLCDWPIYAAGSLQGPQGQYGRLDNCVALGATGHGEVRRLMARAGIFVSTSVYEPFGLAALEAALSGAPLLLSDIATYREIWDGAAMFFDADEPNALARCIGRLAQGEELRRSLGSKAAERARRFSPRRQVSAMRQIYDEATMIAAGR